MQLVAAQDNARGMLKTRWAKSLGFRNGQDFFVVDGVAWSQLQATGSVFRAESPEETEQVIRLFRQGGQSLETPPLMIPSKEVRCV